MPRHSIIEITTGAAVLLTAGGFLVYAVANTGEKLETSGYKLRATFDNVAGLANGADVRIAGVKIGAVDSIAFNPKTFQADVTFDVQKDVALTTDSSASIATDGLLGGKYVALASGGEDSLLKPGATITITQGSVNIEALIGKYIFGSTGKTSAPASPGSSSGPK